MLALLLVVLQLQVLQATVCTCRLFESIFSYRSAAAYRRNYTEFKTNDRLSVFFSEQTVGDKCAQHLLAGATSKSSQFGVDRRNIFEFRTFSGELF